MAFPGFIRRLFANDGAGPKLLGSILPFGVGAPKAPGTASAGIAEEASRADHVHPVQTSVSGNAGTATKLATPRTINISGDATGTAQNFDGSANVTIPVSIKVMKGANASANGESGFVPAPGKGAATRYLRSDGSWQVPPDTNTTYSAASQSANGLMSSSDKTKLDGIQTGAQVNPGVASTSANGLVPKLANDTKKYLRSDGSWQVPPDTNTTYSVATADSAGLMSAADKSKLDGIESGAISSKIKLSVTTGANPERNVSRGFTFTDSTGSNTLGQMSTMVTSNGDTYVIISGIQNKINGEAASIQACVKADGTKMSIFPAPDIIKKSSCYNQHFGANAEWVIKYTDEYFMPKPSAGRVVILDKEHRTLPDGGTWMYFVWLTSNPNENGYCAAAGAGGTKVISDSMAGSAFGFAIQTSALPNS